jgi:hypothetical protein
LQLTACMALHHIMHPIKLCSFPKRPKCVSAAVLHWRCASTQFTPGGTSARRASRSPRRSKQPGLDHAAPRYQYTTSPLFLQAQLRCARTFLWGLRRCRGSWQRAASVRCGLGGTRGRSHPSGRQRSCPCACPCGNPGRCSGTRRWSWTCRAISGASPWCYTVRMPHSEQTIADPTG